MRRAQKGPRRSADAKLTEKALHREYAFEWGLNSDKREIQLTGDIEPPMFDFLDAALTELEKESRKRVTIKINSHGGDVYEALAIVGRIRKSSCLIVTEGYGAIMSAATLVLACGDQRRLSRYSWYMWHEASYYVEGRHSSNKAMIIQAEREEKQWAKAMEAFSNKSADFWLKKGRHVDAYFTPEELLKMNVIDEVF